MNTRLTQSFRCIRAFCLVSSLGIMLSFVSCQGEDPVIEDVLRPVRSQAVFFSNAEQVRTFSGVSKSGLEASLSFKVSGTVKRLPVKVGDKVRKNQRLAEIDPKDFRLEVQRAEASLSSAKAASRNARAEYARVRALYENRNASRNDLDQARATAESSNAQVQSEQKSLELAKLQLTYTRLLAPANCSVASVPTEVNENVQAGQTIVEVVCGSHLEVEVAVPEIFIAKITPQMPVTVAFDAITGNRFPAVVTKVSVSAGKNRTTFPVTVQLQTEVPGFRSGLASDVQFTFEGKKGEPRILVPSVAVGEDQEGPFVYLLEEQEDGTGIVRRQSVFVGELTPEGLEIVNGLKDGAHIVTGGVRRLHDSQPVRLMTTSPDQS